MNANESSAASAAGPGETAMFEVQLNSPVELYGIWFKPGVRTVVDRATLDLMGEAVDHAEPV